NVLEACTLLVGEGKPLADLGKPEIEEQHQRDSEEARDEQELLRVPEAVHEPDPRPQEPRHGDSPNALAPAPATRLFLTRYEARADSLAAQDGAHGQLPIAPRPHRGRQPHSGRDRPGS